MAHPLQIPASANSSPADFDFLQGNWKVQNRKLKARLCECSEWLEFDARLEMRKALNNFGNIENFYCTLADQPFEGMAIRLFNEQTRLWTIYWIDSAGMCMDEHPVCGFFEAGIGKFYARDTFEGKEILVIYQWDATDPQQPIWSQAFSLDDGRSWEWNWEMRLSRV